MEKVFVLFGTDAHRSLEALKKGSPLIAQLAIRYYNELFDIPPQKWGRIRHENGQDSFVSEKHCVFDIRGVIEGDLSKRTLSITHFELRKKRS